MWDVAAAIREIERRLNDRDSPDEKDTYGMRSHANTLKAIRYINNFLNQMSLFRIYHIYDLFHSKDIYIFE